MQSVRKVSLAPQTLSRLTSSVHGSATTSSASYAILMYEQFFLLSLLLALLGCFLWERWRYDLVSVGGLILAVIGGVVSPHDAFAGFGHPATITVAAVLIVSKALTNTGVVDLVAGVVKRSVSRPTIHVLVLTGIGAVLSSVMNNVGALAILLPVAVHSCAEAERSPALVLMPMAFGTMLGGMMTLIGPRRTSSWPRIAKKWWEHRFACLISRRSARLWL